MAQLLECDRCGERVPGQIKEPKYDWGGAQLGSGYAKCIDNGGPTVAGWSPRNGKLLCPQCDKNLDSLIEEFMKPLPGHKL